LPGQVCADRVFIFKITCIAEQCATERYRQTRECILFKEMERSREEQRNNRR
jgi:predicted MarR family transcription regulator